MIRTLKRRRRYVGELGYGGRFGAAEIIAIPTKRFGEVSEEDFVGHETYESVEEMHQTHRSYYGNRVNADTELKIVRLKLLL